MMIELLLVAVLVQTLVFAAILWRLVQLERKQITTIFGISHVWGLLNETFGGPQKKSTWNRDGPLGETDVEKMESPDAWLKRYNEEE
jgi:hypothetical protein